MATAEEQAPSGMSAFGVDNACRRSVSIFSRRGNETPEPVPPFFAQADLPPVPPVRHPRPMNMRQRNWMERTKSVCSSEKSFKDSRPSSIKDTGSRAVKRMGSKTKLKGGSSRKPRGTILNAVPPAKAVAMTTLEEEMATSPNHDIISAISEQAPALHALASGLSPPTSPARPQTAGNASSISLTDRTKSQKHRETITRVGVWINGVVHWDEAALVDRDLQDSGIRDTGFAPKPHLSVIIPAGGPLINDKAISKLVQPKPLRPVVSVAPPKLLSRRSRTPPSMNIRERDVSPESAHSQTRNSLVEIPITPPIRPHAPLYPTNGATRQSRTSSSSSSENAEFTSSSSRPSSSATSIDDLAIQNLMNKPLPPLPPRAPGHVVPASVVYKPYRPSKSLKVTQSPDKLHSRQLRHTRSIELEDCDREFLRTSPYTRRASSSPTLSQAETDLQNKLSTISPVGTQKPNLSNVNTGTTVSDNIKSIRRISSVSDVMEPPARAPTIPKRSRKREWRAPNQAGSRQITAIQAPSRRRSASNVNSDEQAQAKPTPRKAVSVRMSTGAAIVDIPTHMVSQRPDGSTEELTKSPVTGITHKDSGVDLSKTTETILESDESSSPVVPSASAENVLLTILASLHSIEDLSNTAVLNKGMYRVYKENEMELIRSVVKNQSTPAFELREWSPPSRNEVKSSKASSMLEHTPSTYVNCYKRDLAVIERLKKMILEQCQTFIRRETAFAMSTPMHPHAQRFTDAFWRIWCFTKIFGCNKGREDDITGQLDWLKGGDLANSQGCAATVNNNFDFDMSSVLLNPPEYFASSNSGGLTATQLFDMTEVWTCLTALLQGYQDRVEQARQYGVFEGSDVEAGDIEREQLLLEEWCAYLLTLGPHVVLAMARLAADSTPSGFILAQKCGWTTWTAPLYNGSRITFLKEPVAKLYEMHVTVAYQRFQDPREQVKKAQSRQRVANLAAEIRLRRQSSDYKRLPLIDMSTERPMSVFSRKDSSASTASAQTPVSRPSSRRTAADNSPNPATSWMLSPSSLWSPPRKIPTIVEESQPPPRLSRQYVGGVADNPSDRAVQRIVAMGFTVTEAREALRVTDMGDGIRLDRAVELLIRRHS